MSGQAASITATLAGQVVSEGFIEWRTTPWKRRLITRCISMIPALVVAVAVGQKGGTPFWLHLRLFSRSCYRLYVDRGSRPDPEASQILDTDDVLLQSYCLHMPATVYKHP